MDCRDCPRFDAEAGACRDGKLNPQRWHGAVEVVERMGVRAICPLNDFRERLIRIRHVPVRPGRGHNPG
jgi:hypothetical protein